jgi:glycine/D-amino acid oxidase-like deaminating enzyme
MAANLKTFRKLPLIAIVGAGIRGACLAAWLAATRSVRVIVIEERLPGSGISCSNHGRAHIGTWNYYRNTRVVIERDLASYELNRRIPGMWESAKPGLYCIESKENVEQFVTFCENHGIPVQSARAPAIRNWIESSRYTAFEIPEYSFNPARLAARCIRFAQATGRCNVN